MRSKLLLLSMIFCLTRCSDFMAEQSQSEVRPSTVSDIEKILESMAYPAPSDGTLLNRGTEIFTDNVKSSIVKANYLDRKEKESWRFRWDAQMFNEGGGGEDITFWSRPYDRIKGCNLVMEYVDGMQGNEMRKAHIKGEVYVLRAYYYYMLVNFFGLPYNYGDPAKNLAVPLKLSSGVTDERFKRNTVAECYEQILKDLKTGTELMEANQAQQSNLTTRVKYLTGYALMSRIYLHMNDWEQTIKYADLVLGQRPEMLNMVSVSVNTTGVYHNATPAEILWGANEKEVELELPPFPPSDDLLNLYLSDVDNAASDLRLQARSTRAFFRVDSWVDDRDEWITVAKGQNPSPLGYINGGIRTAEMYLNRAEAYIRKYIVSGDKEEARKALADLNGLRRCRFNKAYVDKTLEAFDDADALLQFCLRERRRELCSEANHRWFDLRRLGMPEIRHVFVDNDNGHQTEYVLQKEDKRYVLPIPEEVIEHNTNLTR